MDAKPMSVTLETQKVKLLELIRKFPTISPSEFQELRNKWEGEPYEQISDLILAINSLNSISFFLRKSLEEELGVEPEKVVEPVPDPVESIETSAIGKRLLKKMVNEHIMAVVGSCGGNKSLAAKELGIDRRTLYRKLTEMDKTDE